MAKTISTIYNGENRIPINFDAVKEFFRDHESEFDAKNLNENDFYHGLFKIEYFKKPTDVVRKFIFINNDIDIEDYIRVGMALKRMKQQTRPYKINKLIHLIQGMSKNKKKKYALLIIKEMVAQNFIKENNGKILYE